MKKARMASATALFVALLTTVAAAQGELINDSLRGSSSGTVSGGSFGPNGWTVVNKNDYIYWHVPDDTMDFGAVEFSVRGLRSRDSRPEGADKNEIFHMYDWTYQDADTNYGGYRNGPYKHFIRKTNEYDPATGSFSGKTDSLEMLWKIEPSYVEPDTDILTWNPNITYRFREEWETDSMGNSVIRTWRDGVLIMTMSVPGGYYPGGLAVRIGASTRAPIYPDFGAPVGAVFSDVLISSYSGPHIGTRHDSTNLAHRCGCSSIAPGAAPLSALLAAALALLTVARRRSKAS